MTGRNKRCRVGARAHHARVPQPLIEPLPIQRG
jgi:hypothetical protein